MQQTMVRFLDQENPLEKGIAIHSSILAWKIPWTEEAGRVRGVTKSWTRLSNCYYCPVGASPLLLDVGHLFLVGSNILL